MACWLMKTAPEELSWDDQVKRGANGEPWSIVRIIGPSFFQASSPPADRLLSQID